MAEAEDRVAPWEERLAPWGLFLAATVLTFVPTPGVEERTHSLGSFSWAPPLWNGTGLAFAALALVAVWQVAAAHVGRGSDPGLLEARERTGRLAAVVLACVLGLWSVALDTLALGGFLYSRTNQVPLVPVGGRAAVGLVLLAAALRLRSGGRRSGAVALLSAEWVAHDVQALRLRAGGELGSEVVVGLLATVGLAAVLGLVLREAPRVEGERPLWRERLRPFVVPLAVAALALATAVVSLGGALLEVSGDWERHVPRAAFAVLLALGTLVAAWAARDPRALARAGFGWLASPAELAFLPAIAATLARVAVLARARLSSLASYSPGEVGSAFDWLARHDGLVVAVAGGAWLALETAVLARAQARPEPEPAAPGPSPD